MIFGYQLTWLPVIYLGLVSMVLLVFEVLVGLRVIKFKGRTHMKVHRAAAWVLVGIGVLHGLLVVVVYYGWRIF